MQIHSGVRVNGAAMHCLLLSRELARRGHEVTMVCRPGAWIGQSLSQDPITVVESDLRRWPLVELKRIRQTIRDRQIEIVHTHMSRAHTFGVLLRRFFRGAATIATAHSRHLQLHWMLNDFVIAPSAPTAAYHRRINWVSRQRISVIHYFVDPHRPAASGNKTRERWRNEVQADDQTVLIGIVGDVIPRKGIDTLVEALPRLTEDSRSFRLLAIGKERMGFAPTVRRLAERLGVADRITWLGEREDVAEILTALDILALPSREEQTPMAVLEAMAAGLPVVATRVGGLPECVEDGETGRLVPAGNPIELAAALRPLIDESELRARWGAAGRRRVEQHFSPNSQVAKIETLYQQVIAKL